MFLLEVKIGLNDIMIKSGFCIFGNFFDNQASRQSLNILRNNRGRPNEAVKEPHWKKLSFSEKLSKLIRRFPFVHAIAFLLCFPFGILFAVESHFSFDTLLVTLQV
jgi:hypothetical protein